MSNEIFELFIKRVGSADSTKTVDCHMIDKYRGKLPDLLLSYWKNYGFCSFGEGLFWLVNPEEYQDILSHWLEGVNIPDKEFLVVFARTAFGKLFIWNKNKNTHFTINTMHHAVLALNSDFDFNEDSELKMESFFITKNKRNLDTTDLSGNFLFKKALTVLGKLGADEMYGFEPSLALGGEAKLENISKVKIEPHLLILRELEVPELKLIAI